MKMSVKDIINSQAYQTQAEAWSKSHIFTAVIVTIFAFIFTDINFSWNLILAFIIIFGASLIIAMPTMFINVFLASLMSPHMTDIPFEKPKPINFKGKIYKLIQYLWAILSLIITAYVTYKFLEFWSG